MQIKITTGRYQGQTLPVQDDSPKSVRVNLTGGGTMVLPKNSQITNIQYFTEDTTDGKVHRNFKWQIKDQKPLPSG